MKGECFFCHREGEYRICGVYMCDKCADGIELNTTAQKCKPLPAEGTTGLQSEALQ